MADNFPGPYEIRIFYTAGSIEHQMNLSCNVKYNPQPGDAASTIAVQLADGSDDFMGNVVSAWITLIKTLFAAADVTFDRAELWEYTPGTYVSRYISTYDIGTAGDSASTTKLASQGIMTFRTTEGGVMKIYFQGTTLAAGPRETYAAAAVVLQDIFDFVISDANWILAKDTSYPVAALAWLPGESEAIFKKLYRT